MAKIVLNLPSLANATNIKAARRMLRVGETWNDEFTRCHEMGSIT